MALIADQLLAGEGALPFLKLVAFVLLAYISYTVFDVVWLSPIAQVPGPFANRVSRLPLIWNTFRFNRSFYAHQLIQKYGPIVVIAPNQVHTTDENAMKVIYDKTSTKTRFYRGMGSWKGIMVTLGFPDYKSAAPTRNNLLLCFQNRNLDVLSESLVQHVQDFCNVLSDKASKGKELDGALWYRLLALDMVTDVLWGESSKLLLSANDATPSFLKRFHAFSKYNAMKSSIPGFDLYVRLLGSKKWRDLRNDCSDMDVSAHDALQRWGSREKRHNRDVLSMLKAMESGDGSHMIPDDNLPAYMVEMMAAGSSTTSLTAAITSRMLAHYPNVQDKLHKELEEVLGDSESLKPKDVQDLHYLDAVIRETMRLWPAIPGPLERFLGSPIEVNGHVIPPGVVASTAAFDQGRLEDVFENAEQWNPDRWLDASARMKLNWIPFGHGSRACPGSNLALTELKYALACVFRHFKAVPAPSDTSEPKLTDVFAASTSTGTCWLQFEAIKSS